VGKIIDGDRENPRKMRDLAGTLDLEPELLPKRVPS
jgi:hypothetical protein